MSKDDLHATTNNLSFIRTASAALAVVVLMAAIFFSYQGARKDVTLLVDGTELQVYSFGGTVEELLQENGIVLIEEDRIEPNVDTELADGLVVNIRLAFPVHLRVAYEQYDLMTAAETVGEVLEDEGIVVDERDIVAPALTAQLHKDDNIQVDRVVLHVVEENEAIPYNIQRKEDTTLLVGVVEEVNSGKNGVLQNVWEKEYKNGVMIDKKLLASNVLEEPVDEIVAVGVKPLPEDVPEAVAYQRPATQTVRQNTSQSAPRSASQAPQAVAQVASRGDADLRASDSFVVEATAYTHTGDATASGIMPYVGVVAVDPSVIPMGTNLYVEGYGYAKAADTGSAIKGNRIDVFLDSESQAVQWGRRDVTVHILDEPAE